MGNYNTYRTTRQRRWPILLSILLFAFFVYFMTRRSSPVCTTSLLHQQKVVVYTNIIQEFVRHFEENGVNFLIFGSTLLGSFRHHGLIPYDQNIIHFAVSRSHVDTVRALLLESNFSSDSFNFTNYEVEDNTILVCAMPEIGPSIRISHFNEVGPRIFFSAMNKSLPLSSVFPLTVRPFESLMLPSPACPSIVLGQLYDLRMCCRLHMRDKPTNCRPCYRYKKVPFIERRRYTDQVMLEQLWLDNKAISSPKLLNENMCNVSFP